jgi:hypothetical protein
MNEQTGSCLCGSVQYKVSGEPVVARICWCRTCQKISANGTANAIFPASSIEVTGALSSYTSGADSGNEITRYFCATCGCHLFSNSSANAQFRVIRLGTLDDPSAIKPQLNIWASSAPAWACMDASLQSVPKQPAPPAQLRAGRT